MKKILLFLSAGIIFSCNKDSDGNTTDAGGSPDVVTPSVPALPTPDHIIFVWFENKDYSQIISSHAASYINLLKAQGTLFSNFHALGHPSYPEYIRFFCGTNNNKTDDACIDGMPYSNPNLYTQLEAKGKTFAWYSEDLPEQGSAVCTYDKYAEKHNPTSCFSNVPGTSNKRWMDLPDDYSQLENVVCISPNLSNDMHDGSIEAGDAWLQANCADLINWCKTHNSVFVVYFDENDNTPGNHLPVVALGQPVKAGFVDGTHYDHYNWTRTILSIYGAEQIAHSKESKDIIACWK